MEDDRLNWRPAEQRYIDYLLAVGVSVLVAIVLKAVDHFNIDFWTFVLVGLVVSTALICLVGFLTGIQAREDAQRRTVAPIVQIVDQAFAQRQLRKVLKETKRRKKGRSHRRK